MINLFFEKQSARIEAGELVSYKVNDHEYIHQKGNPGWRNSDTEMFPIIGPTAEANFRVKTPKGMAVQDQHGLLREMEYTLVSSTTNSVVFKKEYKAGTAIKNSKFPVKSSEEFLQWPYDFEFNKTFKLSSDGLEVNFVIKGEQEMPFMLGYHPAFNLVTEKPVIITRYKKITLDEVLAVGSRAYEVENCNKIQLKDKNTIAIKTEGFGSFMLWTEVNNMICIEPITFYPYAVAQEKLHEGFTRLKNEKAVFKMFISIGK